MEILLTVVVAVAVLAVLLDPFRRRGEFESRALTVAEEISRLDESKAAKYREIRDVELEFQTGKLSQQDYERTDQQLRAEAVQILRQLDQLRQSQQKGSSS